MYLIKEHDGQTLKINKQSYYKKCKHGGKKSQIDKRICLSIRYLRVGNTSLGLVSLSALYSSMPYFLVQYPTLYSFLT